jgi:CRP/FNR family nitrogen fixation transcriptional regulator
VDFYETEVWRVSGKIGLAQPDSRIFGATIKVGNFSGRFVDEPTVKDALSALQPGTRRFRRNQVIASEGEAADYIFVVVNGVVRKCKNFEHGGRSVVAFYLRGDLFGWSEEKHSLSVEAASNAAVMFVKRSALISLAKRDSDVAGLLLDIATSQLRRAQQHALLMNMMAKSRVASFLVDLGQRSRAGNLIKLPMSHQDIADHLGLKIETLSRTITELERGGIVYRSGARSLTVDNARLLRQINP